MRSRHESDEDKIKYLLADGRKQLTYLKQLIDMNKWCVFKQWLDTHLSKYTDVFSILPIFWDLAEAFVDDGDSQQDTCPTANHS